MATQLFFTNTTMPFPAGAEPNAPAGGLLVHTLYGSLSPSRGSGVLSVNSSTVAGPTAGIVFNDSGLPLFVSDPIDADVTISGTVTFNLRMSETNMAANAGAQCIVYWLKADGTLALIINSEQGTELSTSEAARNWTATPTSSAMKKGDRLVVILAANDVGTMASGYFVDCWYNGTAAGASGDAYVTFTENFAFQTAAPAGSQIFPTDTASTVATASVDREAWTSRGAGVQTDVTNTAAGPTAPIQVTDTAGGTVVDWFTKQLTAFTLSGMALVNARGLESNFAADIRITCEIAVVASDGTSPTVWGYARAAAEMGTTETAQQFYVSGLDISVSEGQRLRIRFYIDDSPTGAMASGRTATFYYAGAAGATGDSYITLGQTVTEYTPPAPADASKPWRRTAHVPGQRYVTPGTVFGRSWIKKYSGVMVPSYGS